MCVACGDTGLLCSAPEGEIIFCEQCVMGLVRSIRTLAAQIEVDLAWLGRHQAEGYGCAEEEQVYALELDEYERLKRLLSEKKHEGEFLEMEP